MNKYFITKLKMIKLTMKKINMPKLTKVMQKNQLVQWA